MRPEQERVKNLLSDTVTLLCKNGLTYKGELHIEALIGITLDKSDVFLVHINERFHANGDKVLDSNQSSDEVEEESNSLAQKDSDTGNSASNCIKFTHPNDSLSTVSSNGVRAASMNLGKGCYDEDITATPISLSEPNIFIKIEDDEIEVEEDVEDADQEEHLRNPDSVAQQAFMVAGRRRIPSKRSHTSNSPQPHDSTSSSQWDQVEEPDSKRMVTEVCKDDSVYEVVDSIGVSAVQPWQAYTGVSDYAMQVAQASFSDSSMDGQMIPAGCSSWSPSTARATHGEGMSASQTEAKYPSHALQSHNVKEALVRGIVDTALTTRSHLKIKVTSFRMSWFSAHTDQLEQIWQNIAAFREQMDALVTGTVGSSMIVSAFTGTLSGRMTKTATPGVRMTYPGLAYWIVSQGDSLNERSLMCCLQANSMGARIKPLLQDYEQTQVKIANALFVVMKDCMGGFVRRKVDESISVCTEDSDSPIQQSLVRMYVKDEEDFKNILVAQARLKSVGCDVSLHKL